MNSNTWRLIRIAKRISREDPILGYDLEVAARKHGAVSNPGRSNFDKDLQSTVTILKSLKQELNGALEKLDSGKLEEDTEEFSKFFKDEASAEQEELRQILKRVKAASSRTAGPKDFLKGLFKKKKAPKEESGGMSPSYQMDDSTSDEFVEGKRDWMEPGQYVEHESKQNKEFFGKVNEVTDTVEKLRDKPTKGAIESLLKTIDWLISGGEKLLKGVREHLKTTMPEIGEEGSKEEKKSPLKREKLSPEKLEDVVGHYSELLKESSGDENKTIKFLKEFFDAVGPSIKDDRAALAATRKKLLPVLIRVAFTTPRVRPMFLPVIRRMASSG